MIEHFIPPQYGTYPAFWSSGPVETSRYRYIPRLKAPGRSQFDPNAYEYNLTDGHSAITQRVSRYHGTGAVAVPVVPTINSGAG